MINTKIKKAAAIAGITALTATTLGLSGFGAAYATNVGTGSVNGNAAFDTPIIWDDTFGGGNNASGSVTDILIQATIAPSLNMEISTDTINLGVLEAGTPSSGSLDLEIGTNAVAGASITARSQSGGLINTTDSAVSIQNNLGATTDDEVDESYTFESALNAASDSSITWFAQTAPLSATQINDNSVEYTIYTSDKPQATNGINDVTFTVSATADAQTPAGSYEDKVTFTVTGNF